MRRLSAGFWMMAVAVALRAASVLPGVVARRPGLVTRVSVTVIVFVAFLACTVLLARRERAGGPPPAGGLVWAAGGAGLALAAALLWLV